ncbi:uncharacterized protein L203_100606 [Cryptococcus depauperatus CBS 7841]|uniref:GRIP domain-containing protein n=1 Tax=Cryptococcus depauperatus CBS 7841 TaxID=1295531 RepID=A0AAJ8JND0_9TREE
MGDESDKDVSNGLVADVLSSQEPSTPRTSSELAPLDNDPICSGNSNKNHQDRENMTPEERFQAVQEELESIRQEKETLSNQYRGLLGKLTAMRTTLGDKLKEDAEELDRRESQIANLATKNEELQETIKTLQTELSLSSQESSSLAAQLSQLRLQSDSLSSDVLSLTREMRELRGEMERLRSEREEWEREAEKERERREEAEENMRAMGRREMEMKRGMGKLKEERDSEKERGDNLQEVLSEFQAAKDSELQQAISELETQLRLAATSLSEYKLRAANAETRLSELSNDATRTTVLEKELKEKNQLIGKLRHEAVITNEHLTEALRRLRKNQSDNNVDRRLVTNILLSFLATSRGDTKRFEMLSLLSTILSWDDTEREKAGLQRQGIIKGKEKEKELSRLEEKSAEEEAAMNESFSNLFVEFLLKEASQGQPSRPSQLPNSGVPHRIQSSTSIPFESSLSPPQNPSGSVAGGSMTFSPPFPVHSIYASPQSSSRRLSNSSATSERDRIVIGGRKSSYGYGLRDVLDQQKNGQGQ